MRENIFKIINKEFKNLDIIIDRELLYNVAFICNDNYNFIIFVE